MNALFSLTLQLSLLSKPLFLFHRRYLQFHMNLVTFLVAMHWGYDQHLQL